MKYVFGFIIAFLLGASSVEAVGIPFGGRVVTGTVPPTVCTGWGPIAIIPSSLLFPPTPYATTLLTRRHTGFGPIVTGQWIMGFYSPIPVPICNAAGAPVPVLPITQYGTSGLPF